MQMTDGLAETLKTLTKGQVRTFAVIAMNSDWAVPPETAAVLLKHGLIEAHEQTRSNWPLPVTITRFRVPPPVLMEWSRLASRQANP
jgi:hypothetical protein